jgi:hypothetical protein
MKLTSKQRYDQIFGSSKRASLKLATDSLYKYSNAERKLKDVPNFNNSLEKGIQMARKAFVPSNDPINRRSTPNVPDLMNLDAAAGFSFPGCKKSEVIENLYDIACYMQHMIEADRRVYKTPCKLALRGHLHDADNPKSRPVWVYPGEVSILEGKWALPFYKHLEEHVDTVHFGEGAMKRLAKMMIDGISDANQNVEITTDWSTFDATVPNWLIDEAFEIIWDSFDNEYTYHDPMDGSEPQLVYGGKIMYEKNRKLFEWIKDYFMYTPIMLPDGTVVKKMHGIPSGSFFTQAIGSIVNYIVIRAIDYHFSLGGRRFKVLGDDSSFLVPGPNRKFIDPQKISSFAWEYFGLVMKASKFRLAETQTQRKFLGYQCTGYRFIRSTEEWFKLVLYPERDVEFLEQSASRVFAYYILGGCNDEEYCRFFRCYFRQYPQVSGRILPLTRGLKRLFKYVFRLDTTVLQTPNLSQLDLVHLPYLLSAGDSMYLDE